MHKTNCMQSIEQISTREVLRVYVLNAVCIYERRHSQQAS